jgi:hypothetical protein
VTLANPPGDGDNSDMAKNRNYDNIEITERWITDTMENFEMDRDEAIDKLIDGLNHQRRQARGAEHKPAKNTAKKEKK